MNLLYKSARKQKVLEKIFLKHSSYVSSDLKFARFQWVKKWSEEIELITGQGLCEIHLSDVEFGLVRHWEKMFPWAPGCQTQWRECDVSRLFYAGCLWMSLLTNGIPQITDLPLLLPTLCGWADFLMDAEQKAGSEVASAMAWGALFGWGHVQGSTPDTHSLQLLLSCCSLEGQQTRGKGGTKCCS